MGDAALWAAQNGDVGQLKELQFDAMTMIKGRTLLHVAADYGQEEILEYLVEQKQADVNSVDQNGLSVLCTAVYGAEEATKKERYRKCIEYLLSKGASKNGKAPSGQSYIECSSDQGIRKLLE